MEFFRNLSLVSGEGPRCHSQVLPPPALGSSQEGESKAWTEWAAWAAWDGLGEESTPSGSIRSMAKGSDEAT